MITYNMVHPRGYFQFAKM